MLSQMHRSRRKGVWASPPFEALVLVGCLVGSRLAAQTEYANTDGGRPLRVEDATPTERFSLDVHFPTAKVERIGGIARLRVEPALSYGVLPRTAIEARAAFVYREPAAIPRGGMTGFGVGVMHALTTETTRVPGFAIAGEFYDPAGSAKIGGPAYSFRALVTKRVLGVRLHANGTLGSYNVSVAQSGTGQCVRVRLPVVDQACTGGTNPPLVPDGPCLVDGLDGGVVVASRCTAPDPGGSASESRAQATAVRKLRGTHRVVGLGADHAFPGASPD